MKKRIGLAALLGLWLWACPALSVGGENWLDTAQTAYKAGNFDAAAHALEAAYADGTRNAALCLATAQAWGLAGKTGRAALWLGRAALLDPGNPRVRQALATAGMKRPGSRLALAGRFSPRALAWLALGGNAVFWIGLMLAKRRQWHLPPVVPIVTGALVVWLWLEAGVACLGPWLRPQGVVLEAQPARCAPEPDAETIFPLPAGQLVSLGTVRDGYRRITDTPDRVGWIPEQAVGNIRP